MGTQANNISEVTDNNVGSLLRCPRCESEALFEDQERSLIICPDCQQAYPLLTFGHCKIPFIFSNVSIAIHDWCARINGFNKKINQEINLLTEAYKDKSTSRLTKERIKNTLNAKKSYQSQILEHLNCFDGLEIVPSVFESTKIAKNQGVDSYINNVFRDWCWENGENEEMLSALESVIQKDFNAGVCATLGAGASRLSYDFHNAYSADHSVLIDINPILLGSAKRILNNEKIKLTEFPIAPFRSEDFSVEQTCRNNNQYDNSEFTFLLADGLNAPIKYKIFDTVLTPWFIDIVPIDFKQLIPHINRLLKVGGTWLNTGSLAFFHKNQSWNYSQEEISDLLKKFGFCDIEVNRKKINYLASPHSSHGRVENVFSFSAKKKFDCVSMKPFKYLPDWIENINLAVPQQETMLTVSSNYLLQAQVISAIDGQRSIAEIGDLLAKQYGMPHDQASAAVRQILLDNL